MSAASPMAEACVSKTSRRQLVRSRNASVGAGNRFLNECSGERHLNKPLSELLSRTAQMITSQTPGSCRGQSLGCEYCKRRAFAVAFVDRTHHEEGAGSPPAQRAA